MDWKVLDLGSAPAALASLLFDPPEPQIIGKTQCFETFLPFRAPGSSFFGDFLFFDLLSYSLFPDSSHLCFFHLLFSSVHIVGSLTSKLPSIIRNPLKGLHLCWGSIRSIRHNKTILGIKGLLTTVASVLPCISRINKTGSFEEKNPWKAPSKVLPCISRMSLLLLLRLSSIKSIFRGSRLPRCFLAFLEWACFRYFQDAKSRKHGHSRKWIFRGRRLPKWFLAFLE